MVENEKELRKLSRRELLELLIETSKENEELKTVLDKAETAISDRRIAIENAGSLAEAVIAVNKICELADDTAKQYVDNIKRMNSESAAKANAIINDAKAQAESIIADAKAQAQKIVEDARAEAAANDAGGTMSLREQATHIGDSSLIL